MSGPGWYVATAGDGVALVCAGPKRFDTEGQARTELVVDLRLGGAAKDSTPVLGGPFETEHGAAAVLRAAEREALGPATGGRS